MLDFLHGHPDFTDLLRIVAVELSIDPALVEKDYWIMHCLYGLQQMGLSFELKGGTSLSKGYGIIHRFSEDIDIRIEPPPYMDVKIGRNQDKPAHCESRKAFYEWLAGTIAINGIVEVLRDTEFDDDKYRSGGVRLHYSGMAGKIDGLKDGILLEVGFDEVMPNATLDISSWTYDYAVGKVDVVDNRAKSVKCYHPGYTLVEKLQTVSTKYRKQQADGAFPQNFMRHYYDIYCLLEHPQVQDFIGTDAYFAHKEKRFRTGDDPNIAANEAFLLSDPAIYKTYKQAYEATGALYYKGRPGFDEIIVAIKSVSGKL